MLLHIAKAIGYLAMPPGILILGGLVALVAARRFPRVAWGLGAVVLTATYLLSIRPGAELLLAPLESRYPALQTVPAEAEAIVVLGGGQIADSPEYGSGAPGDSTLQRTRFAAHLARASDLPVYTTGGLPLGRGVPTGRLMAQTLSGDYGIAPGRLHQETASRNTREHVTHLDTLLGDRDRVVLVTTAWHMPRAMATFAAGNLHPIPAPTDYHEGLGEPYHWLDFLPSAGHLKISSNAAHEYLGLAYYWVRGWL
ncbi:YdcF family protein [Thiohalorhabdus sp. Cl-TMA]|uniref:YdcF family protein n=1 Tax=Thiohalorhabdus methylotrophus TaxID=3242694 RepID=A0ABV4TU37_9GAMM